MACEVDRELHQNVAILHIVRLYRSWADADELSLVVGMSSSCLDSEAVHYTRPPPSGLLVRPRPITPLPVLEAERPFCLDIVPRAESAATRLSML